MRPSDFRYVGFQDPNDLQTAPSYGGEVLRFTAGVSLNVGDVVQISAANTVTKLTTTPNRVIGVVVGGDSLPDATIFDPGSATITTLLTAGVLAATVGQAVFVLVQGIAYVRGDGVITNAAQIKMSGTTAGRVIIAVSALTIAAGATPVTSSAANGAIISGDDAAGQVIGKNISATTADGDVFLAYINIH